MLKITPLIQKAVRSSFFDEFEDIHKDFEIDCNRLWIKEAEFDKLKQVFQYFSDELLIEGILFKKSGKSEWFRNRYFALYEDRLVCYKDVEKLKMKGVMMLRGVKLEIFENFVELLNLNSKDDYEIFEKKMFSFSRNQKSYTIYAGTHEIYMNWLQELKKCCIITNFNKYYKNIRIIGKGTFAKVMHSVRETDKKDFAIKTFEKDVMLNSQTSNRSRVIINNKFYKIYIQNF
jgi:calcium-dependent protein kinase